MDEELWNKVVVALGLSDKQARIVWCLLEGMDDKQIAQRLGLSGNTLRTYLDRIFRRVGVRGRTRLIARVCAVAVFLAQGRCHQS